MAKSLKDILNGVKSSKVETPDLSDMHDYGNGTGKEFISKHKIEKHADRVGNDDDVYKGKTKQAKYKGVKEETIDEAKSKEGYQNWPNEKKKKFFQGPKDKDGKTETQKWAEKRKAEKEVKEEALDEISKQKAALYAKSASDQSAQHMWNAGASYEKSKEDSAANIAKSIKRDKGVKLAINKLAGMAKVPANEEASCNHSPKGTHCEMHGDSDCSGNMEKKKGKKLLLDKDKKED